MARTRLDNARRNIAVALAARAAALTRLEDAARMELYLWRREG